MDAEKFIDVYRWRNKKTEPPTEKDANVFGKVVWYHWRPGGDGYEQVDWWFSDLSGYTHWRKSTLPPEDLHTIKPSDILKT